MAALESERIAPPRHSPQWSRLELRIEGIIAAQIANERELLAA